MTAERRARSARPVKRSFTIAGHQTSISLEAEFWDALKAAAASEGTSVAELVARIDRTRGEAGLSSAVRVFILALARRGGLKTSTLPASAPATSPLPAQEQPAITESPSSD